MFDLAVLGVAPVANIYGSDYLEPILDYLDLEPAVRDGVLAGTPAAGATSLELDVEAVAAARPDLLVITEQFVQLLDGPALDSLEQIAELSVIPDGVTWQERSRAIAAAVGLEGSGEERIAAAEEAIAALGASVSSRRLEGREVSALRFAFDQFLAFIPPSLPTEILTSSGLAIPTAATELVKEPSFPDYTAQAYVSAELLGGLDGDLIVVTEAVPGDGDAVIDAPTLAGGQAVSTEAVLRVPYFLWALNSVVAVEQICDDLTTGLELLR